MQNFIEIFKVLSGGALALVILAGESFGQMAWRPQTGISGRDWHSIFFVDAEHGWVGGDWGQISTTGNGGNSWGAPPVVNPNDIINDVYFFNEQNGFAVGAGQIFHGLIVKTTDGGQSWSLATNGLVQNNIFTSIHFADEMSGWATSFPNGKVYHTSDGGDTWTEQSTGADDLYDCFFLDASTGVVVGYDGKILHTTDGGATWTQRSIGLASQFQAVTFIDGITGWAVGGDGVIAQSTDGGINWSVQKTIDDADFFDIQFVDANTGWAVGGSPSNLGAAIYYTVDGGDNWELQKREESTWAFESISVVDANHAWVAGPGGVIMTMTVAPTSVTISGNEPADFSLIQNYPNPFNPSTTIRFSLTKTSWVKLTVFDVTGREAVKLVDNEMPAGTHSKVFDARDLTSGVYFYRLQAEGITQTRKLTLIK